MADQFKPPVVYLAGPIEKATLHERRQWRIEISALLANADICSFDPAAAWSIPAPEDKLDLIKQVQELDDVAVSMADIVVVGYLERDNGEVVTSSGTDHELKLAQQQGKMLVFYSITGNTKKAELWMMQRDVGNHPMAIKAAQVRSFIVNLLE